MPQSLPVVPWFYNWAHSLRTVANLSKPVVVGVFADQDPAKVNEIAEQAGLDIIQLSGLEAPGASYCRPVIKAIHVGGMSSLAKLPRLQSPVWRWNSVANA